MIVVVKEMSLTTFKRVNIYILYIETVGVGFFQNKTKKNVKKTLKINLKRKIKYFLNNVFIYYIYKIYPLI